MTRSESCLRCHSASVATAKPALELTFEGGVILGRWLAAWRRDAGRRSRSELARLPRKTSHPLGATAGSLTRPVIPAATPAFSPNGDATAAAGKAASSTHSTNRAADVGWWRGGYPPALSKQSERSTPTERGGCGHPTWRCLRCANHGCNTAGCSNRAFFSGLCRGLAVTSRRCATTEGRMRREVGSPPEPIWPRASGQMLTGQSQGRAESAEDKQSVPGSVRPWRLASVGQDPAPWRA